MTSPVQPPEAPARAPTWEQIEQVVARFAALAQTEISLSEFAAAWLDQLLRVLPASTGAVWWLEDASAECQSLASVGISDEIAQSAAARLSLSINTPVSVQVVRCGEFQIAQGIVRGDQQSTLAIEACLLPGLSPQETDGALRLVRAFTEIAEEYLQRRELREWRENAALQRSFGQLLLRIHSSLDPLTTAYTIANDGRTWLACDRVSVALRRGGQTRVLAISGVDTIDERAEEVRCLADLAAAVANMAEPLFWSGGSDETLPPELARALHAYLDRAHAQRLAVVPLRGATPDAPVLGVLIVEWLDARVQPPAMRRLVGEVARHSEVALRRALEHDLPLLPLFVGLGRAKTWLARRATWVGAVLVLGVAIISGLVFIKTDFALEAHGTLQPQSRRHLFAPADGVVESVAVEHGDEVTRGQELLSLRDAQLDLEFSRATGELETAQSRLATIRAKRSSRPTGDGPRDDERELAAEEEQLKQKLIGLQGQLQVLEAMRAEMRIVSPLDGQVLTWHARDLLEARPVKRGQLLLTIADRNAAWELDLRVADDDVGRLLDARRSQSDELPVTFLLATDPSRTHHGFIEQVALNTEAIDGQAPSALVTARLTDAELPDSRAGAGVIARIHCGRRSIGYVWLHDLIDAVRTRLLF